jgi:hypothetical protein
LTEKTLTGRTFLGIDTMNNANEVEIVDNSDEVVKALKQAILVALETCGLQAENYAKKLCPVDTGNLRNSITHEVDDFGPCEMTL